MTTKPFDQFNKRLFQELLSPFGQVTSNFAVPGEERAIDIFFVPDTNRRLDPAELGCLAAMLDRPALLEPFRSQLKDAEVCNCLLKLLLVHAEHQRQADRTAQPFPSTALPHLWILAATVSDRLLADFWGRLDPTLGDGFYQLAPRLQTTIVALAELPSTPETLWLRLLGSGRTQEEAIAELLLLPESDPKRSSALSLLVSWRISMEVMAQVDSEERRILMALSQAYQEWEQQTRRQGLQQGLQQGRQEGEKAIVLRQLTRRVGALPESVRSRLDQLSLEQLEDLAEALLDFTAMGDLQRWLEGQAGEM